MSESEKERRIEELVRQRDDAVVARDLALADVAVLKEENDRLKDKCGESGCLPIEEVTERIIVSIIQETADMSLANRLMVLGYVAEHCKAYEKTVLAHDYHDLLYRRGET